MAKKVERSFSLPVELMEGAIHKCDGHVMRRSKYLKRWKKEVVYVVPGKESFSCTSIS